MEPVYVVNPYGGRSPALTDVRRQLVAPIEAAIAAAGDDRFTVHVRPVVAPPPTDGRMTAAVWTGLSEGVRKQVAGELAAFLRDHPGLRLELHARYRLRMEPHPETGYVDQRGEREIDVDDAACRARAMAEWGPWRDAGARGLSLDGGRALERPLPMLAVLACLRGGDVLGQLPGDDALRLAAWLRSEGLEPVFESVFKMGSYRRLLPSWTITPGFLPKSIGPGEVVRYWPETAQGGNQDPTLPGVVPAGVVPMTSKPERFGLLWRRHRAERAGKGR